MTSPNDAMTPASRPAYDHNLFVDRLEALELVLEKARRLAEGGLVRRQVVIFLGERGAGKTWLLQELEYRLGEMGLETLLIDLERLWLEAGRHVGFAVADFRALLDGVARPLVLLLDNVQECNEPLLNELEKQILASLAREPDMLIVLAERGRPHYWLTPSLREVLSEHRLGPFGEPDVWYQVQKQIPTSELPIETIERLGGGYPWLTYLIARLGPQATDLFADLFWGDDEDLLPYAEALCVLRAFDEVRMGPLLQAYCPPVSTRQHNSPEACRDPATIGGHNIGPLGHRRPGVRHRRTAAPGAGGKAAHPQPWTVGEAAPRSVRSVSGLG